MIEKKRPRRKKPRINKSRNSNQLRTFETKGINTPKTRGAVSKALEKYTSLAQDAFSNGDRIVAESYYQFAEHYQRVLNENFEDEKSDNINPRFPKNSGINEEGKFDRGLARSRYAKVVNQESTNLDRLSMELNDPGLRRSRGLHRQLNPSLIYAFRLRQRDIG